VAIVISGPGRQKPTYADAAKSRSSLPADSQLSSSSSGQHLVRCANGSELSVDHSNYQ
jgi:hypothetical protein